MRSVPLIDQAVVALDGLSKRDRFTDPDDLVSPGDREFAFDDFAMRDRFYAALKRAKLRRVRFHDLRHTFGSIAVRAFPVTDVRAYMGHADIQTTMVYVHFTPQHDAAEKLTRAFAAEAGTAHCAQPRG